MKLLDAPLYRLIPRNVTVVCGSQAIQLNYAYRSRAGTSVAVTELPYELENESRLERLNQFRFRVARLRYEASRS